MLNWSDIFITGYVFFFRFLSPSTAFGEFDVVIHSILGVDKIILGDFYAQLKSVRAAVYRFLFQHQELQRQCNIKSASPYHCFHKFCHNLMGIIWHWSPHYRKDVSSTRWNVFSISENPNSASLSHSDYNANKISADNIALLETGKPITSSKEDAPNSVRLLEKRLQET